MLLSSSTLASVKSINVNEKLAQIIVPASGNVKCSRLVSWQREPERSSKYWEVLNSAGKKNEIRILDIRSSVINRKTFSIEWMRCSKGLHRPIASYLQVLCAIVSVFRVNSYIKIYSNRLRFFVVTVCHIIFNLQQNWISRRNKRMFRHHAPTI